MIGVLGAALLLWGAAPPQVGAAELRALEGYFGLYRRATSLPGANEEAAEDLGLDLRARLERTLDRSDLAPQSRTRAIALYRELARAMAEAAAGTRPVSPEKGTYLREMYGTLIQRAQGAGMDTLPLELEMLRSPHLGLDAQEIFNRLSPHLTRLLDPDTKLEPPARSALRDVLLRLLGERSWPVLEKGDALTAVVELLLRWGEEEQGAHLRLMAVKLREWASRLLGEEGGQKGEAVQDGALLNLYRCLHLAGAGLTPHEVRGAVEGLLPLVPPGVASSSARCEGALERVAVGEVRLAKALRPGGARLVAEPVPPLPPSLSREAYLLAPRRSYRVELLTTLEGGLSGPTFWVLARPGPEARLVVPRCLPPGMVPITAAETAKVTFLADRRPWTVHRFLEACHRSGSALFLDKDLQGKLQKHTALREVLPSHEGGQDLTSLLAVVREGRKEERLEQTFWVEAADAEGQAAAYEIASVLLSGNTGFRETPFSLPTAVEAQRLVKEGAHFALEEPAGEPPYGLFNATRLVPEPADLGPRPRYAVRSVLRLDSP